MKIELNALTLEELKNLMFSLGEKPYRGEQIFSYFHRNMGLFIDEMNIIPTNLRNKLKEISFVNQLKVVRRLDSKLDDTKKYIISLHDNNIIESVVMKYKHGYSICVSTQVGCKMGCKFCASTKGGMIRNLSAAEMLGQVYLIEKDLNISISNIVMMGSGEPLDNFENTIRFMEIIHDDKGHNLSYRNITLSTCGIVPKIYELAEINIPITLSISLHSPFDKERMKMMPITKKYSIKELLKACKIYTDKTKRRLTFEYTLIEGVNDRQEDIEELVRIVDGINSHINIIPLNPIEEYEGESPSSNKLSKFYNSLVKNKLIATIRSEKGSDISGSCGQLRNDFLKEDI